MSFKKIKFQSCDDMYFASDHEDSDSDSDEDDESDDCGRQNATWDQKLSEKKLQKRRDGLVERTINVSGYDSSSSGDYHRYIQQYETPFKGVAPTSRYDDDASNSSEESSYEPAPSSNLQRSKVQEDDESRNHSSYHRKEYRQPSKSQAVRLVNDGDSSIESSAVDSESRRPEISKASYHSVPNTSAMSKEQKEKEELARMIIELKLETLKVQEQLNATEYENVMETQASYQRMGGMDGGNEERGLEPAEVQGMLSEKDEMAEMIQKFALETKNMEKKLAEAEKEVAVNRTLSQVSLHKLAMLEDEADEEGSLNDSKPQITIADGQHLADDDDDESLDPEEVVQALGIQQRSQRPAKQQHPLSSSLHGPSRVNRYSKPYILGASSHPSHRKQRGTLDSSFTYGEFHESSCSSWLSFEIARRSNDDAKNERAPDPPEFKTQEARRARRGPGGRPQPAGRRASDVMEEGLMSSYSTVDRDDSFAETKQVVSIPKQIEFDTDQAEDEMTFASAGVHVEQKLDEVSSSNITSHTPSALRTDRLVTGLKRTKKRKEDDLSVPNTECETESISETRRSKISDEWKSKRKSLSPKCPSSNTRRLATERIVKRASDLSADSEYDSDASSASETDHGMKQTVSRRSRGSQDEASAKSKSRTKSRSKSISKSRSKSPRSKSLAKSQSKSRSKSLSKSMRTSKSSDNASPDYGTESNSDTAPDVSEARRSTKTRDGDSPRSKSKSRSKSRSKSLARSRSKSPKRSSSKSCSAALSKAASKSPKRSSSKSCSAASSKSASKSPKRSISKTGSSALRRKVKSSESVGSHSKESSKEKERLLKKLEKLEKEADKRASLERKLVEESSKRSLLERKRVNETSKISLLERKLVKETSKRSLLEKKEREMAKERSNRSLNGRLKKEKEASPRDFIIGVPTQPRKPPKPVRMDASVYSVAIMPTPARPKHIGNFVNDKEMW